MEARENLRGSGILLSISSLPSPYGIGTLGREAYNFVDLLGDLKQKYWQVLPVGPTIFGDSPYQPSSGCAGNIYFIDLDKLVDEGLLEKEEILGYNWGTDESEIDYAALHQNRCKILQKAFERFDTNAQDFQDFVKKQSEWLEQYALFMTLKTDNLYKNWSEWPSEYRNTQTVALEKYQKKNYNTITFWKFCQYKFFEQWEDLKNYANSKGIYIIGDISFYVGYDSVDVWAERQELEGVNVVADDYTSASLLPGVKKLLAKSGWMGTKVMMFAFDGDPTNEYLPHNYTDSHVVAYIGTHDNETIVGSFSDKTDYELAYLYEYLNIENKSQVPNALIRELYHSTAELAIVQMQDILELGNEARMNYPSTVGHNWRWRMTSKPHRLDNEKIAWIRNIAVVYRR